MSRKVVKSADCLDRISSLPDKLLAQMLSFLPTRCAMRTSILSKRWSYLFTLTNCLSFDDYPCSGMKDDSDDTEDQITEIVMSYIHGVMKAHKMSPIEKFSLDIQGDHDESNLNSCICYAIRKGVQDLNFMAVVPEDYGPPNDLLTCKTLVRLKMQSTEEYSIFFPLSAWLPNLKLLHLQHVTFTSDDTDESVERLFSGCEFLEELTLKQCDCDTRSEIIISAKLLKILTIENCSFVKGRFEIDAPNLARLSYGSNIGVEIAPSWKDSCFLTNIELSFSYDEEEYIYGGTDTLLHDVGLVKAAADKVTELYLDSKYSRLLLTVFGHEEIPVLRSLSRLHLCGCSFNAWKYVTSLLDKSPQLETVIFNQCYHNSGRGAVIVTPSNEDLIAFTCHAKVIEVCFFCGGEYSRVCLGHLLRNAGVLKRLILYPRSYGDTAEKQRINKDFDMLQMLPRASKDCCIELKK